MLKVNNLRICFPASGRDWAPVVKGTSWGIKRGETLAVVGESGSGKSVSALALTRLLPQSARLEGQIHFEGRNVLDMNKRDLRRLRGGDIAYIFQEPSASLNPVFTVGRQIAEAVKLHHRAETDVQGRVVQAMESVGIRDAARRTGAYPHELSGGMQQRVMIAMALACQPKLLVADEPTTALDVTIQKQIIELLVEVRERTGMAILLITHNFGIVQGFADRVCVMYRGDIVETGPVEQVLRAPEHPYTRALIDCIPRLGARRERLTTIDHEALARYA
jgi:ABC-type dipeptide/oligopeptide/nickel transport system ATPase component